MYSHYARAMPKIERGSPVCPDPTLPVCSQSVLTLREGEKERGGEGEGERRGGRVGEGEGEKRRAKELLVGAPRSLFLLNIPLPKRLAYELPRKTSRTLHVKEVYLTGSTDEHCNQKPVSIRTLETYGKSHTSIFHTHLRFLTNKLLQICSMLASPMTTTRNICRPLANLCSLLASPMTMMRETCCLLASLLMTTTMEMCCPLASLLMTMIEICCPLPSLLMTTTIEICCLFASLLTTILELKPQPNHIPQMVPPTTRPTQPMLLLRSITYSLPMLIPP